MKAITYKLLALWALLTAMTAVGVENDYRERFLSPDDDSRSIIIWQWMDGLVNKEGITHDLEAFKAAGLSGVQNFQIGGERQMRVSDTTCAIGSEKWKELMKWAMTECRRLGLTLGTHNCPGWSSSAYSAVTPEYSMQKLVYTEQLLTADELKALLKTKGAKLELPRPQVDPKYDYYEDVALLAFPADSVVAKEQIVNLSGKADKGVLTDIAAIPQYEGRGTVVMRIGHTTNGKTNESQSPLSGQGLECDKMRREAVKFFWDSYPQMLIDLAGDMAGTVFNRIEIDSYEAGGQDWSVVLPEEFFKRKGYDIMPYLPLIVERVVIGDRQESASFMKDLADVATSLFAENYYGYMNELAGQTPGMKLLIEPYGTNSQKPFPVLDIYKILDKTPGALIATEFWVRPDWGWKDMRRHEKVMRESGRGLLYAEGFTCWPLHAWKDDAGSLKPVCDKSYCTGVNRQMLHAGAVNPWLNVEPGMSFGFWGTQFVPTQTWWQAGGARALFDYMARCQSLLQRGIPAPKQREFAKGFNSYHRVDGVNDIIFLCNPTDKDVVSTVDLRGLINGRQVELWDAYNLKMESLEGDSLELAIEPCGSRFIVISSALSPLTDFENAENKLLTSIGAADAGSTVTIDGAWTVKFAKNDAPSQLCVMDSLTDWTALPDSEQKYYSGTATYSNEFSLKKKDLNAGRLILDLGDVKNMATVRINGQEGPVMWKAPFLLDITDYVKAGKNTIEVDVTNLWVNRMIGDEQEPDDIEWSEPLVYDYAPGKPEAGKYMVAIPDWLRDGTPRPSKKRKTVGNFKFYNASSPLMPSGLLGPVKVVH